jgi:TetR/AcrR family transcriptional regulator, repressor for uid operon
MARKLDPQRHEARRQEVLLAAVTCFAEKGFHSTSTAEICRAAGMSPGNLFHYFPTKDAIIQAIAEEDRRETAALFAQIDPAQDAVLALIHLAELILPQVSDPIYARISIEIAAEATRNPAVAEMFAANDEESRRAVEALLRRGVEAGQIDATLDLESCAVWLIALFEGAMGRAAMDPAFDPHAQIGALRDLITRFLRPQRPSTDGHDDAG